MNFSRRVLKDLQSYPGMVRWYDPKQLSETGMRDVITRIFGQYADQRMLQATVDGFTPEVMKDVVSKRHDYSNSNEFKRADAIWVDYTADLGDGFDATYAIASLIAADGLDVPGAGRLPGGRFLLLGGDQVYPFPTRADYVTKFAQPYAFALPGSADEAPKRDLFALPGNHDWYDGLNAFDNMFCKARFASYGPVKDENRIGGFVCPQHRSYWSIRLPHNWWIWGADIQLSHYLDAGQILYFKEVARDMAAASTTEPPKVILCISEPSWMNEQRAEEQGEQNLDTIVNIALDHRARIAAVLTGDFHHYARYYAPELGLNFITAGGGGAYFSPTHLLKDELPLRFDGNDYKLDLNCKPPAAPGQPPQESCWPPRSRSRWLSLNALGFPLRNYAFAMALGFIYWLLAWPFAFAEVAFQPNETHTVNEWVFGIKASTASEAVKTGAAVLDEASRGAVQSLSWLDYPKLTLQAGISNPVLGLSALAILLVLIFYAEAKRIWVRTLMGSLHWMAHLATAVAMYVMLGHFSQWLIAQWGVISAMLPAQFRLSDYTADLAGHLMAPPLMWMIGGFFGGLVWGAYLMVSCLFNRHCDQAFSSLRLPIYRHFLRMKVERDKLTIYPIGLRNVPSRWRWRNAVPDQDNKIKGPLYVPEHPFKPELIDGPIVIRPEDLKGRDLAAKAARPAIAAAEARRSGAPPPIGLVRVRGR